LLGRSKISKGSFVRKSSVKKGSELRDMDKTSIGRTGTFRSKAIARSYVNSERRSSSTVRRGIAMLKGVVGISVRSELTVDSTSNRQTSYGSTASDGLTGSVIQTTIDETKALRSSQCDIPPATPFKLEAYEDEEKQSIYLNFLEIWIGKPISLLLLFAPFACAAHYRDWSPQWIFWLNFLTMVPLASILGDFTEEAALHTNDVVGGLLNASFGNAVEVVVAIQALMNNEIRVVQSSMIGSIFSNLLLVLGMCFFFGGLTKKEQSFSAVNATSMMGLLALSSIALVLPTPFASYYEIRDESVLVISRVAAFFLLFSYIQLLIFQLFTHKDDDDDDESEDDEAEDAITKEISNAEAATEGHDESEEEEASVPMWMALLGLALTTGSVTIFSDFLVESIDGFCVESGISRTFVGLIILPIVGNAVEHITAVSVAMKDKMDLALGVAIGSSTQIALFVVPVTVLWGWLTNKPMTLNFPVYEITLYVLSIFTVSVCLSTGKSNWLLGSILMITYVMLAIGFWFEKVETF